jgi:recombinational DNA repair protein RecT
MGQMEFKVRKEIIRKDENEKWIKLRKELKIIYDNFEDGKIVNKISNKALLRKILRRMAQLEEE